MRFSPKFHFVALAICLATSHAHAGFLEFLSNTANTVNTLSVCPRVSDEAVKAGLALAERCPPGGPSNCINAQAADLKKIADRVRQDSEDRLFDLLAAQHSRELSCAANYAQMVATTKKPTTVSDIATKFEMLRVLRQQNTRASEDIATNPNILEKFCPLTLDDLKPSPNANGIDLFYENCKIILQSRRAYQMVLASIPLSNVPAIRDYADKYANAYDSDIPLSAAKLQQALRTAYAAGAQNLTQESARLKTMAETDGPSPFNRQERYALLSDPRVNQAVVRSGGPDHLQGLLCQADADFHQGADNLSTDLFIGGLVLGGASMVTTEVGVAFFGVVRGLAGGIEAAEGAGQITLTTARLLELSAWGANAMGAYNNVDKSCSPHGAHLSVSAMNGGSCVSAPSVDDLPQEDCILGVSMQILGLTPKSAAEAITMLEKFQKVSPAAAELLTRLQGLVTKLTLK